MRYDFQLEAVTEIFAGGSNPLDADLRPATFRGQMRFWFRAMMARYVGSDLTALHRLEDAAFGSTEAASPFILRLSNLPDPEPIEQLMTWSIGKAYLGFPFYQPSHAENSLRRGRYKEGTRFNLSLQFRVSDKQIQDAILGSFWLLVNFGGVGSRTRRGFGGVRVLSVKENGTPLLPFNYFTVSGDSEDYYTRVLNLVHGWFQAFEKRAGSIVPAEETVAQYTGFGDWQGRLIVRGDITSTNLWFQWWGIILRGYRNHTNIHPADLLQTIDQALRQTTTDYRKVVSLSMNNKEPARSYLENDIFGLPIVFYSGSRAKQISVGWQYASVGHSVENDADGRRASPLFLRPVVLPNKKIATLLLFFLGRFLPDGACLPIPCPSGEPLSVPNNSQLADAATDFLIYIDAMHSPLTNAHSDLLFDLAKAMPPL